MAARTINKFEKQPWESYRVGADYSKVFMTGEELVVGSSSIAAFDRLGVSVNVGEADAVVSGAIDVDTAPSDLVSSPKTNALLRCRIFGGTQAKSPYKLTFYGVSNGGNQYEVDVFMYVKEK